MSLYISVGVNRFPPTILIVTRTSGIDRTSGTDHADDVNTYRITRNTRPSGPAVIVGEVTHRYGDGANRLAAKALQAYIESGEQ